MVEELSNLFHLKVQVLEVHKTKEENMVLVLSNS
jgi:hypothetical protein